MCELCDGTVTVSEYFEDVRATGQRRMLRKAAQHEVFGHRRDGWFGFDCLVCRLRVVGFASRLAAEIGLMSHASQDHAEEISPG